MHALHAIALFLLFSIVVNALSAEEMDSDSFIKRWTEWNWDTAVVVYNFMLSLIAVSVPFVVAGGIIACPIVFVVTSVAAAIHELRRRRQARAKSE